MVCKCAGIDRARTRNGFVVGESAWTVNIRSVLAIRASHDQRARARQYGGVRSVEVGLIACSLQRDGTVVSDGAAGEDLAVVLHVQRAGICKVRQICNIVRGY